MSKLEETVFLGEVDYHGEPAEAFREEYSTHCRFVIKTKTKIIVVMEYPKIS